MLSNQEIAILEVGIDHLMTMVAINWGECRPVRKSSNFGTCRSCLSLSFNNSQQKVKVIIDFSGKDVIWVKFLNFSPFNEDDGDLLQALIGQINLLLPNSFDKLVERTKGCKPGTKIFYWKE